MDTGGERGWEQLRNGTLLQTAEGEGYEVLITTDQSMPYQQNMTGRRIAVVVVGENKWPLIRHHVTEIAAAMEGIVPGDIREVQI